MDTPGMLLSVRDVARILGLHESRIRYWAQTGFINPTGAQAGRRLYTFVDLLGIKAAKELLDRGIPLQRVRKNLQALREAAPKLDQPLNQLRVCSDGEHLVVAQREGTFDPLSGQLLLDFEVDAFRNSLSEVLQLPAASSTPAAPLKGCIIASPHPPAAKPAAASSAPASSAPASSAPAQEEPPALRAADRAPDATFTEHDLDAAAGDGAPNTAYGWFLRGCSCEAEPDRLAEAERAYQQALELDPSLAAAHTNLGNLYYGRGERQQAQHHYQAACALDPDQPEAHFNLGNILEEEGDLEMAVAEHRRALACNPDFADAHFNLALLLERTGNRSKATEHWQRFLQLSPESPEEAEWREQARERIAALAALKSDSNQPA